MNTLYFTFWAIFLSFGLYYGCGGRETIAQYFRLRKERTEFEAGCADALVAAGVDPKSAGPLEDLLRELPFQFDRCRGSDTMYYPNMEAFRMPRTWWFPTRDRWQLSWKDRCSAVEISGPLCTTDELRAALVEACKAVGNTWVPYAIEGHPTPKCIALIRYRLRRFIARHVRVYGYGTTDMAPAYSTWHVIPCLSFGTNWHNPTRPEYTVCGCFIAWGFTIAYTPHRHA